MSFTHETTITINGETHKARLSYDHTPERLSLLEYEPAKFDIYKIELKHDDEWQSLPHLLQELDHAPLVDDIKRGLRVRISQ